jgi:hypothetical protein
MPSNSMSLLALITSMKNFDFKIFKNEDNRDIHNFNEGDLVMFSGKFTYRNGYEENPMFVCF